MDDSDRPTCPPTAEDSAALAFAARVAELDAHERRKDPRTSNLLRAIAEGWQALGGRGRIGA